MSQEFVLDLTKKFELNLTKAGILTIPVLRTRAAIDYSGSMADLFRRGFVQRLVDLFIPAALKFDDNGELELGFFNTEFEETEVATLQDAGKYMATKGLKIVADGGTKFGPVIAWTMEEDTREEAKPAGGFFSRMKAVVTGATAAAPSSLPDCGGYIGIVTDGANSDRVSFERQMQSADKDTFYQFIGLGSQVDDEYLEALAAKYVNVGFFHIVNPLTLDDDKFYEQICNPKFAAWVAVYNKSRGHA